MNKNSEKNSELNHIRILIYSLFLIIILVSSIYILKSPQNEINRCYLNKNNKYISKKSFNEYKSEVNELFKNNRKITLALTKRSLFLENLLYNIDMELKNLTKYFDVFCKKKNFYKKVL